MQTKHLDTLVRVYGAIELTALGIAALAAVLGLYKIAIIAGVGMVCIFLLTENTHWYKRRTEELESMKERMDNLYDSYRGNRE